MKTALSLLAGVAIGVGIGMLIAPEKGSKTRTKLANSTGDWMEKLKSLFTSIEDNTNEFALF